MARELHGWMRYTAIFGGIIVAGTICSFGLGPARSPTGVLGPSVLQAESPVLALVAMTLCFAMTTGVAAVVGRLTNAVIGLFVLGTGLYVPAIRFGTVQDLAFGGESLGSFAGMTLIWAVLVGAATFAVFAFAGRLPDMEPRDGAAHETIAARLGLRGLLPSLLILPLVWALCRSPLQGQSLAAVTLAAMAAGVTGRVLAPDAQPRLMYVAPIVFGAIGHLIASLSFGGGSLIDGWVEGDIPILAYPRPIDYAAGSLMGISLGIGWGRSFVHHEEHEKGDRSVAPAKRDDAVA